MKKIYLVISVVMMFSLTSIAQICDPPCTPDVTCEEVNNPGEICPLVLPTATVGVYYDETVTVIPPAEYSGLPVIYQIRIDDVQGLPEGMVWCKSQEFFVVTNPYTRYCCHITGTAEVAGEYPLTLYITPYLNAFGTPIEQAQMTDDTSLMIIVVPQIDPPVAAFTASATTAETGVDISFTDLSTNSPTAWAWTFEGGTPPTSSDQNPTVQWSVEGVYDVSLTAINDGGENTMTMTDYITIDNGTGIFGDVANNIKIYPNPASTEIIVEAEGLISVTIVDILGKVVYSTDAKSEKEIIDISNLNKANYFVKIKTTSTEITKSITIK
ncbi:MAG: T9SS type A sorting domain-containing protein [Bacteroidales bacterium]|nr:T9SS type A sorting domain-containing protein [Bacteroidales bacterium]